MLTIAKRDRDFDDSGPRSGCPVHHLDLESVPIRLHGREIEPGHEACPVGTEPRRGVGHR